MYDTKFLELIPMNIAVYKSTDDGDFSILYFNKIAEETEKISRNTIIGKKVTEVFPGITKMGLFEVFERVSATGKSEVHDMQFYDDGRISGWRKNMVSRLDSNIVMSMYEDVSVQKNIEKSMLQKNRELKKKVEEKSSEHDMLLSLFDNGTAVLFKWLNDEDSSTIYASQSVDRLLGYKSTDFTNNTVSYMDLIHKDDLQNFCDELDIAFKENRDYFELEPYRIYTKSGDVKWVYDCVVPAKDKEGHPKYFLSTVVDITAIKEKDKQLLQHYKLAQMGEMISMIAHQWRQPLNTISITASKLNLDIKLNSCDLSLKEEAAKFKEHLIENLSNIESYTQTLSKTIDDFRNFYKPDNESKMLNISEPVDKALFILEASLLNNGIVLNKVLKSLKDIKLFDSEMMHVVLNILKNAEDNFKDKKIQNPKIDIVSYDTPDSVVLEILDNGGGIPETIINKIFDPYFSSKDNKAGTGLGLHMSKIIVEDHHKGSLHVKNSQDGACFTIELYE